MVSAGERPLRCTHGREVICHPEIKNDFSAILTMGKDVEDHIPELSARVGKSARICWKVGPRAFNASNSCKTLSSGNVSSRLPINASTCRRTSGWWPRASITARAVSITTRRNGRLFTIYETRRRRESSGCIILRNVGKNGVVS
jgi:hypothetical protein